MPFHNKTRLYFLIIFRDFDCNTCRGDFQAYIDIMVSEKTAIEIKSVLAGPKLCLNESFNLNDADVKTCQRFVLSFIEPALKTLFADYAPNPIEICQEYFDQCTAKNNWWSE